MLDRIYTFFAFASAVFFIPGLITCYIVVRVCHNIWLHFLSIVHSDLDFIRETTVRTLVDTRRNQGIFAVLLRIEGNPRVDVIQRHLLEVISRVDKLGEIRFPKLSMPLVSQWGSYAWKRPMWDKEEVLNQVLVVGGKATHRGRPLTEANIREHVSDIITRYLPREAPPWQLVILPCANSEYHYLLLRMHHLLLTDGDINIADLLPLASLTEPISNGEILRQYVDSPLLNVLEKPTLIKSLYATIIENLKNRWNEFTSNNDPVNRPELLKTSQSFSRLIITFLIAFVGISRKLWLGYNNVNPDISSRIKYIKASFNHELLVRGLSLSSLFESILISFNPVCMLISSIIFACDILMVIFWYGPIKMLREICAVCRRCVGYAWISTDHSTIVDAICDNAPLVIKATGQFLRLFNVVYYAPRLFLDEMILSQGWPGGTQIPLCGRKVVSWSKPVSGERLREICNITGFSCTEILLTSLGGTLSDYYIASGTAAPASVPITARRISSSYLFSSGPNVRPQDALSGLLCLKIPVVNPYNSYRASLNEVSASVATARRHQHCVYAMSILQTKNRIVTRTLPSMLVAILFRFLSKKYTVAVTELMAGDESGQVRSTTWGRQITDIIYWRPPQANISMSLCLNYYGDQVTLAVMSDALLSPHHMSLTEGFPEHVEALAKSIGAPHFAPSNI